MSQKYQKNWKAWRIGQLKDDMRQCHPRWPQERQLIKHEIRRVKGLPLFDVFGAWFYMEWIILGLIVATIATHFLFYYVDTVVVRHTYTRIISIVNLLVWLRLLKYVRPFPGIGTLVIILGQTTGDFLNWVFLFLLLLIPFSAAFWITFGGISDKPVEGFAKTGELMYSVFQIAVGDNFDLKGLTEADPVMARILVVLYVTAVTIITLNLLIALLSETFSRVYHNAVANTIMQKAVRVVESEQTLTKGNKMKYREHMSANCSPEVVKVTFGGRIVKELPAKTDQSMYLIHNMKKVLDDRFSKVYGLNRTSDFDGILSDVKRLKDRQENFSNDLMSITSMLKKLEGKRRPRKKPKEPLSKEQKSSTFSSIIVRLLPTSQSKKESEPLLRLGELKRWKSSEMDVQSESGSRSRSRRKSEKSAQDDENGARAHSGSSETATDHHGNGQTTGANVSDSAPTNPAYQRERENDSTALDDISL